MRNLLSTLLIGLCLASCSPAQQQPEKPKAGEPTAADEARDRARANEYTRIQLQLEYKIATGKACLETDIFFQENVDKLEAEGFQLEHWSEEKYKIKWRNKTNE